VLIYDTMKCCISFKKRLEMLMVTNLGILKYFLLWYIKCRKKMWSVCGLFMNQNLN